MRLDFAAPPVARDLALLAARLLVGGFLVWGVTDNIVSAARMAEFARFLGTHGFPLPGVIAPLSVALQFVAGAALILGLGTRWAGLLTAAHFAVALTMVDLALGIRAAFPAAALVAFGLIFAAFGGGRIALDAMSRKRKRRFR